MFNFMYGETKVWYIIIDKKTIFFLGFCIWFSEIFLK